MGDKKKNVYQLNWSTTSPVPFNKNVPFVGSTSGTMSGTSTIYSNVMPIGNFDNSGLEITWTGTPTGTISVMCSVSGQVFYALTFNPALAQPLGAGGGYLVDLNQVPFGLVMLQYTNSSGTGVLTAFIESKDLN